MGLLALFLSRCLGRSRSGFSPWRSRPFANVQRSRLWLHKTLVLFSSFACRVLLLYFSCFVLFFLLSFSCFACWALLLSFFITFLFFFFPFGSYEKVVGRTNYRRGSRQVKNTTFSYRAKVALR